MFFEEEPVVGPVHRLLLVILLEPLCFLSLAVGDHRRRFWFMSPHLELAAAAAVVTLAVGDCTR